MHVAAGGDDAGAFAQGVGDAGVRLAILRRLYTDAQLRCAAARFEPFAEVMIDGSITRCPAA